MVSLSMVNPAQPGAGRFLDQCIGGWTAVSMNMPPTVAGTGTCSVLSLSMVGFEPCGF